MVRAEESRDVVPMLCHFACRAEPRTVGVDLLSKPLERIRNLECLKIAGCSGMLARTVRARAPTAPGSRAALAGSLPQFWARAESCRSIPTSRGTIMFALKSEPRPADPGRRRAFHHDSLLSFSSNRLTKRSNALLDHGMLLSVEPPHVADLLYEHNPICATSLLSLSLIHRPNKSLSSLL